MHAHPASMEGKGGDARIAGAAALPRQAVIREKRWPAAKSEAPFPRSLWLQRLRAAKAKAKALIKFARTSEMHDAGGRLTCDRGSSMSKLRPLVRAPPLMHDCGKCLRRAVPILPVGVACASLQTRWLCFLAADVLEFLAECQSHLSLRFFAQAAKKNTPPSTAAIMRSLV